MTEVVSAGGGGLITTEGRWRLGSVRVSDWPGTLTLTASFNSVEPAFLSQGVKGFSIYGTFDGFHT